MDASCTPVPLGPRRLHHIATIEEDCFEPLREVRCDRLRLVYGMCYSGCSLRDRARITSDFSACSFALECYCASVTGPFPGHAPSLRLAPGQNPGAAKSEVILARSLSYRNSLHELAILEMTPRSSTENWPYADYPTYLPYFPLKLGRRVPCTLKGFVGFSCQPPRKTKADVIVIVPPSPVLGMSLWGHMGDAEGVQIVFECDLIEETVKAYNKCT